MKHIFLDCGGHCGESVQRFMAEYPNHDFYSFEPNTELLPIITRVISELKRPAFLYPGAVWTHDGSLEFFIGHDQGSTAATGKIEVDPSIPQVNYSRPITVPCIDLSAWIIRNIQPEDNLIVKMDIEGGEYYVLPKMILDKSIDLIDTLYCEWHYDRFPNITEKYHAELKNTISTKTDLREWF